MTDLGEPELFDCERRRMRLTAGACAGSWLKARALAAGSVEAAAACKGCSIGAANAGQPASTSRARNEGDRFCCRCHRPTVKLLVAGSLCISCYNRQLEILNGRNARGNRPVRLEPLFFYSFSSPLFAGGRTEIPHATCAHEALMAATRRTQQEAIFAWDGQRAFLAPEDPRQPEAAETSRRAGTDAG